MVQYWIQHSSK